jgi:DNA-binding beta-propeller fold protein YncE
MKSTSALRALCLAAGAWAGAGCGVDETVIAPPNDALYFPVGLAAHPDGRFLYVANAGFDRRFNAGTVTVVDTWTRRVLPEATVRTALFAGELAVARGGAPDLAQGPLERRVDGETSAVAFTVRNRGAREAEEVVVRASLPLTLEAPVAEGVGPDHAPLRASVSGGEAFWRVVRLAPGAEARLEVRWRCLDARCQPAAGAGEEGVLLSPRAQLPGTDEATLPLDDGRAVAAPSVQALLVTREDNAVTAFEVNASVGNDAGHLQCGQGADGRCDDAHRVVRLDGLTDRPALGGAPYGLALDGSGFFLSHVERGELSRWTFGAREDDASSAPVLRGLCRLGLTGGASSVARHPTLGWAYVSDRFGQAVSTVELLDPLNRGELGRVSPEDCRMEERGALVVDREPTRGRTRGLAFSADGTRLYVASNSDASLRVFETSVGPRGRPPHNLLAAVPLGAGPNVVRVAGLRSGELSAPGGPDWGGVGDAVAALGQGLVYASAFEDDRVVVVDPSLMAVVAQIETGRGPHDIAFMPDAQGRLHAWVANFRDHTLTVIDVDPRSSRRFSVLATVR